MRRWLFQPVDIASLVFFRIVFGVLGFADVTGSFVYYHFMEKAFQPDSFQFYYYGFSWVRVFPEPFMSLFFLTLMGLAAALTLGWRYRWTAPLFALGFTYYFLLEKAHYLNHAYLYCWLAWVMALLPAWREWSLDVKREPEQRVALIPRWSYAILPFLMGMVYFFGGIAKLNADWVGHAMPLQLWLQSKSDLFLIGPLLEQEWVAWTMAWGGALFDLTIVFLLLSPRTRLFGLIWAFAFHLTNHLVFNIGIFPYLSLALTALFFPPSWPRKWVDHLAGSWPKYVGSWQRNWQDRHRGQASGITRFWQNDQQFVKPLIWSLGLLLIVQVALPLRHHLLPGDVAWSEEGHRYAWRMMLRTKYGRGYFIVKDRATGEEEKIRPREQLRRKQARKLFTHPDMILQFAHYLRDQAKAEGRDVAVYAHIRTSLNDGDMHPYVDATADLAQEEWSLWQPSPWILWPSDQ